MKVAAQVLLQFFLATIIVGCYAVPTFRVPQPWIRTLSSTQSVLPSARLKIEVTGSTAPLLGSDRLSNDAIGDKLSHLLQRRGFVVDTVRYDYVVKLLYRTERRDRFAFSSMVSSINTQAYALATGSGSGATSGLGVSIARAIGALASGSRTLSLQTAQQQLSYTHTISIEFLPWRGTIVWKGESTWDSDQLDLISGIVPAFQLLLSGLPTSATSRPNVPEVRIDRALNYYKLECVGKWFTCPALPYRIMFAYFSSEPSLDNVIPSGVKDRNAFAAYTDLIETAEYALPSGNQNDWKDPLDESLWKHVTLGGQYALGGNGTLVNVLITLNGRSSGYYVDECRVVSDAEFAKFSAQFAKWKQALKEYYDVYTQ